MPDGKRINNWIRENYNWIRENGLATEDELEQMLNGFRGGIGNFDQFEEIDLTTEEELGPDEEDDTDENIRERQEEPIPSRGKELVTDLSTMFALEEEGVGEYYFEGRFECESCRCWSRSTCRWNTAPSHNSLSGREITHEGSTLLGLRCIEAWRLQSDQFAETSIRLRYEGGHGSNDLWDYPEHLLRIEDVKIGFGCELNHYWIYRGSGGSNSSWLFAHEFGENNIVQVVCYQCVLYQVLQVPGFADRISWGGRSYDIYHRMVEWKFIRRATIQTETNVVIRTSKLSENIAFDEINGILSSIPGTADRGLFRLVF